MAHCNKPNQRDESSQCQEVGVAPVPLSRFPDLKHDKQGVVDIEEHFRQHACLTGGKRGCIQIDADKLRIEAKYDG